MIPPLSPPFGFLAPRRFRHAFRGGRLNLARMIAAAMLAGALAGCATQYRFKVDALRSPGPYPAVRSFTIRSAAQGRSPDEAAARVAAPIVREALLLRGMEEAPPGLEPDIEVGVEFLFSGPVNAVRTFVEHVYVTPLPNPVAVGARDGGAPAKIPLNPPHPIRAGERTVVHKVTIYRKLLRLTARDLRTCDERAARELWQVSVFNEDGSADVARYARLMCAVAMEVYDRDTGSAREIVLSERDGRVTLVERGRAPRPPPPS